MSAIRLFSIRHALFVAAFSALGAGCVAPLIAQEIPVEGPIATTALINVESKKEVPLDAAMLTLDVNGHATPIQSVMPVRPQTAQVAILIDDGLRGTFGLQIKDLTAFLNSLPPGMQVMVGYMRNGTVAAASEGGFTADHAAVAEALHITTSIPGINASPYFCLSEFVKHWPSQQPAARFVLMLTNGVDPYNGSTSIMNQDSPYVTTAQEDAERNGVAVYSIYFGDAGMRGARASNSGQSYLFQVAAATGAESFYEGQGSPIALAPYLDDFRKHISESYTVSFMTNASHEKADTLERIKLKTGQSGVKIHAPDAVHPGVNLE